MSIARKLAVKRPAVGFAVAGLVSGLLLVGCSGGGSSTAVVGSTPAPTPTGTKLALQSGQQSYLFYGESDHTKLLSIRNVRVIDPKVVDKTSNAPTVLLQREGTPGAGVSGTFPAATSAQPKPSTAVIGFNAADNSYSDLYVNSLHYVSGGQPYKVSLMKETGVTTPAELPHSNATGLKNPVYKEIEYLGTQVFLTAKDANNKDVLVFPRALDTSEPMPFDKKTLLTIAYDSYGASGNGIIAYDSALNEFEHCVPTTAECPACGIVATAATCTKIAAGPTTKVGAGATATPNYKFLGDIGGTSESMLLIDDKLYKLNKNASALALTEVPLNPASATFPATSTKTFAFSGDSAYFVDPATKNITRLKSNGTVIQVNNDGNASKIHGFTDEWVIYGNADASMYAAKKDGTTTATVMLSETTQTTGHRISNSNMAWDNKLLYTTYKLDIATGKMTYQACMFDGTAGHDMSTHTDYAYKLGCKDNGFWAALTAAKKGKLNFNASFPYTPYALLRVDVADENGGGTLVAIDPATPLGGGDVMGSVPNYSFDTFMQQYNYRTKMIDSDGYVVIYGKDDAAVKGDAFLVNLTKPNSLVNLTNEPAAGAEISASTNALHCHGRTCATCHSFAGGKMFMDRKGSVATDVVGYNIRFDFKDGTSKMARKGKGKGENFNLPLKDIVDSFTVVVVDENTGAEVNRSNRFSHGGKEFANCDLCHHMNPPASIKANYNNLPGTISIDPVN